MKTLMTNLETLGFTKEAGLNGLSNGDISVSLHWSGEEAVVAINGKQVFKSGNEAEIIEFVKAHLPKKETIEVSEVEYNDDLNGFVVELKDGRIVQVQFERETNRLDADFGTYYAVIDRENDYGLDLSDKEEAQFYEWMSNNKDVQNKVKELNAE
ncbi:hypothetical protein Q5M62_18175 [Acinetobacter baumannii]|nr:hypothetical protein [Acinetobacter baumannii]